MFAANANKAINQRPTQLTPLLLITTGTLSSALLFLIQPLISKYLLPWYGGSASVWVVAVFFFQLVLLLGYSYAQWLTKWPVAKQVRWHSRVVLSVLLVQLLLSWSWTAPILPTHTLSSTAWLSSPGLTVLLNLTLSVGLPFWVLASTNTLIQTWLHHHTHRSPYWLYGWTNAISLLAIASYPFVIEPHLGLVTQSRAWFLLFVGYVAILSWAAQRLSHLVTDTQTPSAAAPVADSDNTSASATLTSQRYLTWLALAALPSMLLVAFTNHLTQGISPVLFLWLLPLGLYLVSFTVAFGRGWQAAPLVAMTCFATLLFLVYLRMMEFNGYSQFWVQISVYASVLATVSILCHGLLYQIRPPATQLSHFYVALSLGGVVGGGLVSFVAPLVFARFWEVDLLILASLLLVIGRFQDFFRPGRLRQSLQRWEIKVVLLSITVLPLIGSWWQFLRQPLLHESRSFYGQLRVVQDGSLRKLMHGSILHGTQSQDPAVAVIPNTYYASGSGVERAITTARGPKQTVANPQSLKIGVVGLGTGSLAGYCQPGDELTFYEINPAVVTIAHQYFTYLAHCPQATIVLGDARLSLAAAREQPHLDVLAIDAFSDDAIPVHLLTKEAINLYLDRLQPQGILAVHISNRYLSLERPLKAITTALNVPMAVIEHPNPETKSVWVLISRDPRILQQPAITDAITTPTDQIMASQIWTDDYSNLWSILKK